MKEMTIIERFDSLRSRFNNKSLYSPGSVERVFEYNERTKKNESLELPVFIKLDPEEKKKKRSIN